MKNFHFFPLVLLSALVFLASCRTSYVVPIEIQKPADLTIPMKVDGLLVVNNAVPQPENMVATLTVNKNDVLLNHKMEMDTTLWATVINTANTISDANFFDKTSVLQEIVRDLDDGEWLAVKPIPQEKCDSLYEESGCNVILSIDRLFFSTTYSVTHSTGEEWTRYESFVNTKCRGVLSASVYLKSKDRKLTSFNLSDTALHFGLLKDTVYLFQEVPTIIARELAELLSRKLAACFVPDWELTERILYTSSNSKMRKADKYFDRKDWNNARIIWEDLFYKKGNNHELNQVKMASNIGTAYEMEDNITMALYWIQKATNIYNNIKAGLSEKEKIDIDEYLAILNSRIQNNRILDLRYE